MQSEGNVLGYHYLELPSEISVLYDVENYLYELKDLYMIDDEVFSSIIVAVTEAVTNAIKHGNKYDPEKKVTIQFVANQDKYVFIIVDEGEGFDYRKIKDPTCSENLLQESGRGLFIIQHLSDAVVFNEKGNQVTLIFDHVNEPSSIP
jgi:serine/threonine-protein kinase RsbW